MRKANVSLGRISIDMTPMIDIVFQLLIFFVMTLKIAPLEGDLAMQMPQKRLGPSAPTDMKLPPMTLTLRADARGDCSEVRLNERTFSGEDRWQALHAFVAELVGEGPHRTDAEVQIVADFDLKHEHTVQAITSLSGSLGPDQRVKPLIEKISFAPGSNSR